MKALRTLRVFWKSAIEAELEYRANFFVQGLSSALNLVGSLFSISLFYRGGGGFPGYTQADCLVVLGLFMIHTGIIETWLAPNLSRIVRQVVDGTLDFVLLKPIDSQLHVSLRSMSPWGLPDVLLGVALCTVGGIQGQASLLGVAVLLVPLLSGVLLLYNLWFAVSVTTMWFTKIYNATEVLRGLLDAGRFPLAAYPAAYRFVFSFIVPVVFLTTVPADALLLRADPLLLIAGPLVAVAASIANRFFWRVALRSYTGASG